MSDAAAPPLARLRALLTALCVVAFVIAFAGTHLPGPQVGTVGGPDKLLHALGYLCLGASLALALAARLASARVRVAWCCGVLTVYAALDELTQPLVGRDASLGDWLADVAGLLLSVVLVEVAVLPIARRMWGRSRSSSSS